MEPFVTQHVKQLRHFEPNSLAMLSVKRVISIGRDLAI